MSTQRKIFIPLLTLGLIAGITPAAQADTSTETYIVQLKGTISAASVASSLGSEIAVLNSMNAVVTRLTASKAASLASSPNVKSIQKDFVVKATGIQTNAPWNLDMIDSRTASLDHTYSYPNTGSGVTVYVIDSGLRAAHSEFASVKVKTGVNFVEKSDPTSTCGVGKTADATIDPADTYDQAGHGTAVSSLIVGAQYGVAKGASIVPVRVLDCDGIGYASDFYSAVDWIIAHHPAGTPAVANMSLGTSGNGLDVPAQALINAGITVVAAAGNQSADACSESPARVPAVITVAAVTQSLTEPSWPDGQSTNYGSCVDVYAPGDRVVVANANGGSTTAAQGTSFSTPLVSGAAALVLAENPSRTPAQVSSEITTWATYGVVKGARSANRLVNVGPKGTFSGAAPTMSQPVRVSQQVRAIVDWSPMPSTVTYQWYRNGAVIPGATASTYQPIDSDLGTSLAVEVRGDSPGYIGRTARSAGSVVAAAPDPGMIITLAPTRLVDTRLGHGPLGNGQTLTVNVAGVGGASKSASAALVNITTTEVGASGYVTGHASGTATPLVSSANFTAGGTAASLALIPIGSDGKIALTVGIRQGSTVQIIVDLQGFVAGGTAAIPGAVATVKPARIIDTRQSSAVGPDATLVVPVVGRNGVPANASAVFVNVTVTAPRAGGFLTVYPSTESRPTASNLNFSAGQTIPNLVVAKVGTNGSISIYNRSPGSTQIIVDIQGYVVPGEATASGAIVPVTPTRVLDTRYALGSAPGAVPAGQERVVTMTGNLAAASGAFMNLTVTETKAPGYLSAYPSGPRPLVSNLNFQANSTVPNLATVGLNASKVTLYNGSANYGTIQMVADVFAYIK